VRRGDLLVRVSEIIAEEETEVNEATVEDDSRHE
jgi:hypothetical protein